MTKTRSVFIINNIDLLMLDKQRKALSKVVNIIEPNQEDINLLGGLENLLDEICDNWYHNLEKRFERMVANQEYIYRSKDKEIAYYLKDLIRRTKEENKDIDSLSENVLCRTCGTAGLSKTVGVCYVCNTKNQKTL